MNAQTVGEIDPIRTPPPVWLLRTQASLPSDLRWLTEREREFLSRLSVEKRRRDWLLGRWVAKCLLLEILDGTKPTAVEILPRADGSPNPCLRGGREAPALSLSHRAGGALAVTSVYGSVGCDLELVEARSHAFVRDYFCDSERSMVESAGVAGLSMLANVLWSAKESLLKLHRRGLMVDPRSLAVELSLPTSSNRFDTDWHRLSVDDRNGRKTYQGWWSCRQNWIATVVTEPPSPRPVPAQSPCQEGGKVPAS